MYTMYTDAKSAIVTVEVGTCFKYEEYALLPRPSLVSNLDRLQTEILLCK